MHFYSFIFPHVFLLFTSSFPFLYCQHKRHTLCHAKLQTNSIEFEFIAFQVCRRLNASPQKCHFNQFCVHCLCLSPTDCVICIASTVRIHKTPRRSDTHRDTFFTSSFFQQDQNIIITKFVWCILKYLPASCVKSVSMCLFRNTQCFFLSFFLGVCMCFFSRFSFDSFLKLMSSPLKD